jgi:hypothetical protein
LHPADDRLRIWEWWERSHPEYQPFSGVSEMRSQAEAILKSQVFKDLGKVNEIIKQIVDIDQELLEVEKFLEGFVVERKRKIAEKKQASLKDRVEKLRWKGITQLCRAGLCKSTEGLTSQEYDKICESSIELNQGWHYVGNGDWC